MRKWVHGYKQDVAIKFGLSNDELLILRHFEDFANSKKMDSFFDGQDMYYWVNYDKFLSDLPLLKFNKTRLGEIMVHDLSERPVDLDEKMGFYSSAMQAKVKKRKYLGILKMRLEKKVNYGTRTYFAFTNKFYLLKPEITENDVEMIDSVKIPSQDSVKIPSHDSVKIPNEEAVKIPNGFSKNTESPFGKNTEPKIDYKDRLLEIDNNIYSRVIDRLNQLADKKYKATTNKTKSLITARLNEGFKEEDFYKVIEIKTKAWKGTDMDRFLRPETLFGPKFEGYLNEIQVKSNSNTNTKKASNNNQQEGKKINTAYHGACEQHFRRYSEEELERQLLKQQEEKRKKALAAAQGGV